MTMALTVAVAYLPASAGAHEASVRGGAQTAAVEDLPATCPGERMTPDKALTGEFGTDLQGSSVLLPFDVPKGTTAVRVKYCYDTPETPIIPPGTPSVDTKHTLDLGLYEPRADRSRPWGVDEFRGWGGSSHPDVTVSAEGFSSEADYQPPGQASPRPRYVAGKTTRAFRPGPIEQGEWAVELGVGAVVPQSQGDRDGKVAWRVEIDFDSDRAFADEPYRAAPYDPAPAKKEAGWYGGDLHVHGEHSALGDATMRELFSFGFRPRAQGGAGLDFLTLSDYVSGSAWGEVGRHQGEHPGKLIIRSAEVITYRGHVNNHGSAAVVDYRDGALFERGPDGSLERLRGRRPASEIFDAVHRAGGFTQINHPTIFPSEVPLFSLLCRGCPWDYSPDETDYSKVDAIEVATGPLGLKAPPLELGSNPFTLTGIEFYEQALARGNKIAAVGSSDSHNAGRSNNPITQAPIGEATTKVYAEELSEAGIECGVEAGRTYVKVTGNGGPDLRFDARPPGSSIAPAIMGDTLRSNGAEFSARVLGGAGRELLVLKDGTTVDTVPVTTDDFTHRFAAPTGPGRYRLQLMRNASTIETASSPIYLEQGSGEVVGRDCTPLRVRGSKVKQVRVGKRAPRVRCRASGGDLRACTVTARMSVGTGKRRKVVSAGTGRARFKGGTRVLRLRLTRAARREIAKRPKGRSVKLVFVADDGDGAEARHVRRVRLLPGDSL